MMPEHEHHSPREWGVSRFDHDVACMSVQGMAFDNHDTLTNMKAIVVEQLAIDADSFQALWDVGKHLIPLEHDGNISADTTRHEVYQVGMNMALCTLDQLCLQFDVDIEMFRNAWRVRGLVKVLDLNDDRVAAMSDREKYESISQGIIASGLAALDELGDAYEPLIDAMTELNSVTATNPGVLKASYGYVLGGGLAVLNLLLQEREIKRLTTANDPDAILDQWTDDARIDTSQTLRDTEHRLEAARIANEMADSYESVQAYLCAVIEHRHDKNERDVEILNALAYVRYPNELGNFALDEAGEAFFYGSVLALDTMIKQVPALMIDENSLTQRWRAQHINNKLYRHDEVSESQIEEVDRHITRIVTRPGITVEYSEVLTQLTDELAYDENEASAFYEGFYYMLSTGEDAVRACKKAAISQRVKDEMVNIDQELEDLLKG